MTNQDIFEKNDEQINYLATYKMLIMLDKRQKVIMPAPKVHEEVFRSMKVEVTSKTPYTDATQIGRDTSELQSHHDLVCRLLLEKKKQHQLTYYSLTKNTTHI